MNSAILCKKNNNNNNNNNKRGKTLPYNAIRLSGDSFPLFFFALLDLLAVKRAKKALSVILFI